VLDTPTEIPQQQIPTTQNADTSDPGDDVATGGYQGNQCNVIYEFLMSLVAVLMSLVAVLMSLVAVLMLLVAVLMSLVAVSMS
jgi:uncharacterized membrane protein